MRVIAFSLLFLAHSALANTGACYSIGDADARAYCLAKAKQDAGLCYNIQRAELRAMCLAEVPK